YKGRSIRRSSLMKQKRREIPLHMPYVLQSFYSHTEHGIEEEPQTEELEIFQNFSGHAERANAAPQSAQTHERNSAPVYRQCAIPFMDLFDLPRVLPPRLTRLLPQALARELRCVPV